MIWRQYELQLTARSRGFHLVTREVLSQIDLWEFRVGLLHLQCLHTSASLTLNENASPEVRTDLEQFMHALVPDDTPYFQHTYEGPDDMPAHVKTSLLGSSLMLPIRDGQVVLGTWQGIYLGEHRERAGLRRIVATAFGEDVI